MKCACDSGHLDLSRTAVCYGFSAREFAIVLCDAISMGRAAVTHVTRRKATRRERESLIGQRTGVFVILMAACGVAGAHLPRTRQKRTGERIDARAGVRGGRDRAQMQFVGRMGRTGNRRALPGLGGAARGLFARGMARHTGSDGRVGVSGSWEGAGACRQPCGQPGNGGRLR